MTSTMDSVSTDRLISSDRPISSDIQFETIEDSAGFRALEADWRGLCERADGFGFFQRYDWLWRVWQRVASVRGRSLCIVVGRSEGRVVLIWPLMRDRRQLRMLAADKVEYRDIIVERSPHANTWMDVAWGRIKSLKNVDVFLFQDVRADSNLNQFLKHQCKKGWKYERKSLTIHLDRFASWDAYAQSLPKRMMADQKRQWRRIMSNGTAVRFDVVSSSEELRDGLDWMLRHKVDWLKATGINERAFTSDEYTDFVHDFAQSALKSNHLLFAKLSVDGNIVAAGLGYKFGTEFVLHNFTYDAAWQNYSPGRLLLEKMVGWCFDNGVTLFDFMPDFMLEKVSYKTLWANGEFWVTDYLIPVTLRGSAMIAWHASGLSALLKTKWVKVLYRYLPRRVRQRLYAALLMYGEYAGQVKRL